MDIVWGWGRGVMVINLVELSIWLSFGSGGIVYFMLVISYIYLFRGRVCILEAGE